MRIMSIINEIIFTKHWNRLLIVSLIDFYISCLLRLCLVLIVLSKIKFICLREITKRWLHEIYCNEKNPIFKHFIQQTKWIRITPTRLQHIKHSNSQDNRLQPNHTQGMRHQNTSQGQHLTSKVKFTRGIRQYIVLKLQDQKKSSFYQKKNVIDHVFLTMTEVLITS